MYEYKSQEELYQSIKPAFKVKLRLLKEQGRDEITERDIWDYLRINKWKSAKDLSIADIVSDIIHLNVLDLDSYMKNKKDAGDKNEL